MPKQRRTKGEGSYEKTASGKVRHVRTIKGRRVVGPPATTKREALALFQEKLAAPAKVKAAGKQQPIKPLILQLFPEDYPRERVKHPFTRALEARWAGSTLDGFRKSVLAIAAGPLGSMYLEDLTQHTLQKWVDDWDGSPRTIGNYYNNLRTLAAIYGYKLPEVTLPAVAPVSRSIIQPDEWPALFALAKDDFQRIAFILLFRCGLRNTEACGLRVEHYNRATRELVIQGSASRIKGEVDVRKTTKTQKVRSVPVRVKWLREYLENAPPGYVLHRGNPEEPYSSNALGQLLFKLLKGTRFEGITPQSLRRSAATAFALSDVPIEGAAAIMGHSSKMLVEVYAQIKTPAKEALMDRAFGDGD